MAPANCRVTSCPHSPFPCPPLPLWPAHLPAGPHGSLVLASGLLHLPCAVSYRTWLPLTSPLSPGSATAPAPGPACSQASYCPRVQPHQLLATRRTFLSPGLCSGCCLCLDSPPPNRKLEVPLSVLGRRISSSSQYLPPSPAWGPALTEHQ